VATIAAVEKQIFDREGFRVKLTPLREKTKAIPDYGFTIMAPQRWKISEWKTERLGEYIALIREITIFRGDGEPVKRDMQLGNLRDTYYQAEYGTLTKKPTNVVKLEGRRKKKK
jgi:hypothetical protein